MSYSEYPQPEKQEAIRKIAGSEAARKRRAETRALRLERFIREDEREPEVLHTDSSRDSARLVSVHGGKLPSRKPVFDASMILREHFEAPEDEPTTDDLNRINEEVELGADGKTVFEAPQAQETDIFSAAGLDVTVIDSVNRPIFAGHEDMDRLLMSPRDRRAEAEYYRDAWGSYASTHQDQE